MEEVNILVRVVTTILRCNCGGEMVRDGNRSQVTYTAPLGIPNTSYSYRCDRCDHEEWSGTIYPYHSFEQDTAEIIPRALTCFRNIVEIVSSHYDNKAVAVNKQLSILEELYKEWTTP